MINKGWLAKCKQVIGGAAILGVAQLFAASPVLAAGHDFPSFDPYSLAWALVNFFILLALLYKFGYTPILNMLDERKKNIEASLNQAETIRAEVEKMNQETQDSLLESRKEAQEIVARAQKIAEETKNEIIAKAKEDAENERARAIADIQNTKEKAVTELRDTAATLAILAAEKVLGKAITVEDHQKMVKDFVNEVGDRLC